MKMIEFLWVEFDHFRVDVILLSDGSDVSDVNVQTDRVMVG